MAVSWRRIKTERRAGATIEGGAWVLSPRLVLLLLSSSYCCANATVSQAWLIFRKAIEFVPPMAQYSRKDFFSGSEK